MKNIIIVVLSIVCLWFGLAALEHECCPRSSWNCSEYQVTLEEQYLLVENCGRLVAEVPYDRIGVLDSIFIDDNQ